MIDLTQFSIDNIIAKLKEINHAVNWAHANPFPKEESRWLSRYQFHPQFVQVNDDGSVRGGLSQLVAALIDFSFVRSVAADAYSIFGAPCYDPVSLFVLDLCRYLDKIADTKHFCSILRDPDLGQPYRTLAGLREDSIPCRATLTNFRGRLGESRYLELFHTLVSLVEKLGFLSYRVQATDGTLFPPPHVTAAVATSTTPAPRSPSIILSRRCVTACSAESRIPLRSSSAKNAASEPNAPMPTFLRTSNAPKSRSFPSPSKTPPKNSPPSTATTSSSFASRSH